MGVADRRPAKRFLHLHGAETRTQGVVVVPDGDTEDGEHGIPDELLERSSVADHGFCHDFERVVDSRANLFRVQLVDQTGVAHQVREECCDHAAVARLQMVKRGDELRAADMAETRTGAGGRGTFRAEHRASFGIGGGDGTPCGVPAKPVPASTPRTAGRIRRSSRPAVRVPPEH